MAAPPNMAFPPIRLVRISALKIEATTPCVLEMHVPITLPHRLDPSLPAPPYNPDTVTGDDLLERHAFPVLRRLMAAFVSHMFGPEDGAAVLKVAYRGIPAAEAPKLRLVAEFDAIPVAEGNSFDLAAGY